MGEDEAEELRHAAVLHDVGKIGIPDAVLLKPGRLDADEIDGDAAHTTIGGVDPVRLVLAAVQLAETIALTHHERWDGTGYPAGLAREEIPLAGPHRGHLRRVRRAPGPPPYKERWSLDHALVEILRLAGTHFDPELTRAFLEIAPGLAHELALLTDDPRPAGRR